MKKTALPLNLDLLQKKRRKPLQLQNFFANIINFMNRINKDQFNQNQVKKIEEYIQNIEWNAIDEKIKQCQKIFEWEDRKIEQYFANYKVFEPKIINIQHIHQSIFTKIEVNKQKIYYGQIQNGKKNGSGITFFKQGHIFEGHYINNNRTNKGLQIFPSYNVYIGHYLQNKKHGNGIFIWRKQVKTKKLVKQYYNGQWWYGNPHGYGRHVKSNGDIYMGQYRNGLRHGDGQQYFSNQDRYKGSYINGFPEGTGFYKWADGSFYKGQFKQGIRSGFGQWFKNKNSLQCYKGNYEFDKKSGFGIYIWDQQKCFKGQFLNDLRHGYGQYYQYNVLKYAGNWIKGNPIDQQNKQFNFQLKKKKKFVKSNNKLTTQKLPSMQKRKRINTLNSKEKNISKKKVDKRNGSKNNQRFQSQPKLDVNFDFYPKLQNYLEKLKKDKVKKKK